MSICLVVKVSRADRWSPAGGAAHAGDGARVILHVTPCRPFTRLCHHDEVQPGARQPRRFFHRVITRSICEQEVIGALVEQEHAWREMGRS